MLWTKISYYLIQPVQHRLVVIWEYTCYFLRRLSHPRGVEWSENWKMFPHCNNQGKCWMHSTYMAWCRCRCVWCRMARRLRRKLNTEPHGPGVR